MVDLSVVMKEANQSILKCIDYIKECNFTVQVVDCEEKAIGKCIFNVNPNTYYEEYFFHIQVSSLLFVNPILDFFRFDKIVCIDDKGVMSVAKNNEIMFKSGSKFRRGFVLKDIFMGYTTEKLGIIKDANLPDDRTLQKYAKKYLGKD